MIIGGLQKTTLIDFPGTIACTVFTVGCNFRCPFCHNRDLVTLKNFRNKRLKEYSEKEILEFLEKRKQWLDGVCLTGGEPTIQADLPEFIAKIKKLGYRVKLDTNGTNPTMLAALYRHKMLDYVAMDVKAAFADYRKAANFQFSIFNFQIRKSIKTILQSGIGFEFRTTVVPGIHNPDNLHKLAINLCQIAANNQYPITNIQYYIQPFRPQNCLDRKYLEVKPFSRLEMQEMLRSVKKVLPKSKIRGEE